MGVSKNGGKLVEKSVNKYQTPQGPKLNRVNTGNGNMKRTSSNTSGSAKSMGPCNHGNCGSQNKG